MKKDIYLEKIQEKGLNFLGEMPDDLPTKKHYSFVDKDGYKYYLTYESINDKRTNKFFIVSPHNIYSIENIQRYIDINGGGAKVLSKEYKNEKTKLLLECEKCHKKYHVCWNHIWNNKKFQCNSCSRDRGYDEDLKIDAEKLCQKHGYKIIEGTYESRRQFDIIDKQGYKYSDCGVANLSTRNNKTRRFHRDNKYQIDNMKLYLVINDIPTTILNTQNISAKHDYLDVVCVDCGKSYKTKWNTLTNSYPRCQICSKRQSNIEYLVEQYLIDKNIKYTKQKRFSWCREKRLLPFDFFIEDYNTVIEVHGQQHYYENQDFCLTLKEQQERDAYKKQKCEDNGVKYIEIPFWLISQSKCETYKNIIDNIID